MTKCIQILLIAFGLMLIVSPLLAQALLRAAPAPAPAASAPAGGTSAFIFTGAFGAGIVAVGSGLGIGKLAGNGLEAMARQPEVAGNIFTGLIVAAALIEGYTFFALIICLLQK